nr:hypothetical protein BaRGS_007014 [Batillaria attramentaria]
MIPFVAFTGDKGLAPYGLQVVPGRQAGWGQMCLEGLKPEIRQAAGLFVVTEERIYLQRNRIDVTEETFCPTCKKRIGESAFYYTPEGAIYHYSCYRPSRPK